VYDQLPEGQILAVQTEPEGEKPLGQDGVAGVDTTQEDPESVPLVQK
jgi:hypothetical protein